MEKKWKQKLLQEVTETTKELADRVIPVVVTRIKKISSELIESAERLLLEKVSKKLDKKPNQKENK